MVSSVCLFRSHATPPCLVSAVVTVLHTSGTGLWHCSLRPSSIRPSPVGKVAPLIRSLSIAGLVSRQLKLRQSARLRIVRFAVSSSGLKPHDAASPVNALCHHIRIPWTTTVQHRVTPRLFLYKSSTGLLSAFSCTLFIGKS